MLFRFRACGLACLLPMVLLYAPLGAADENSLPFAGDDTPSVLTATRLQQSLFDVPAAVTIIDRQMIEQSGMREIPELLRLVPGMVVGYDIGSDAFVSFHGTSADLARRMQVLVDGRSIYQPLLASVDWIGLPLELADIERIEVIRGPNSATWGANSFFAVVNIITRHPADVERARISYSRGEDGVEDFLARVAQRSGNLDWRLTAAGRSDDGFEENLRRNGADFTDSKEVRSLYGRGVWNAQPATSLELAFGTARMEAEQQYRSAFYTAPPVADRDNEFLSLAWDQELSDSNRFRLQASHSRFKRNEPWEVSLPPIYLHPLANAIYLQNRDCATTFLDPETFFSTVDCTTAEEDMVNGLMTAVFGPDGDPALLSSKAFRSIIEARESRTTVEAHDIWTPSSDLRLVFGVTYDEAKVESSTFLSGHGENSVWRVFAHGEWRLAPAWVLNVGGNQEYDDSSGDFFSPRVALNWQVADSQALRAVYSEAVRTPDILETQADYRYVARAVDPADAIYNGAFFQTGKADGSAPTERIASSELGYYGRFDHLRLTLDLRVFRDRMELSEHNLEIEGSEGFLIRSANNMRMTGGELGLDWRPWPSQRFQINYAYLDMDGVTLHDDNTNFVPQHSGSAAWWQDYSNGWQFGTTYAFYNDLRTHKYFFDRLETRLARKIALTGSQQLQLAAVMQLRLSDEPELRDENGGDRHRGWLSLDWRY